MQCTVQTSDDFPNYYPVEGYYHISSYRVVFFNYTLFYYTLNPDIYFQEKLPASVGKLALVRKQITDDRWICFFKGGSRLCKLRGLLWWANKKADDPSNFRNFPPSTAQLQPQPFKGRVLLFYVKSKETDLSDLKTKNIFFWLYETIIFFIKPNLKYDSLISIHYIFAPVPNLSVFFLTLWLLKNQILTPKRPLSLLFSYFLCLTYSRINRKEWYPPFSLRSFMNMFDNVYFSI